MLSETRIIYADGGKRERGVELILDQYMKKCVLGHF